MHKVRSALFSLGRRLGKSRITSTIFCLVEGLLPLQRLRRNHVAVAFMHPRPSYDPHILVVPTVPFPSLHSSQLSTSRKADLLWNVFLLARTTTMGTDPNAPWHLIINGGSRQDIGQVHGHLIHSDSEPPLTTIVLGDPASSLEGWTTLFDQITRAAESTSPAYSLEIAISMDGGFAANVAT